MKYVSSALAVRLLALQGCATADDGRAVVIIKTDARGNIASAQFSQSTAKRNYDAFALRAALARFYVRVPRPKPHTRYVQPVLFETGETENAKSNAK